MPYWSFFALSTIFNTLKSSCGNVLITLSKKNSHPVGTGYTELICIVYIKGRNSPRNYCRPLFYWHFHIVIAVEVPPQFASCLLRPSLTLSLYLSPSLSLSLSLIALPPSLSASRGDICSTLRNCRSIVNELIGAPRSAGISLAWSGLRSDSGSGYSVHHKLEARRARRGCDEEDGRVVYSTRFGVGCCRGYR